MKGSIFLVQPGNALVELRESGYVTESVLQRYLADHPTLLPGSQIAPDSPRRWLLVTQEMGIPDTADGSDRWALDHLFLDQDAIPTLIETKRSTDSRIRREVVGQMLDYAANGVAYWPVEKLRNAFQRTCEKQGATTDNVLTTFLGESADVEEFWQKVGANLKTGRIRMAFVADQIPQELLRIVEFLNEQMDPAEVIAVEIKQFVGGGVTTLVPRVLGVTATAQAKKQAAAGAKWDEARFAVALDAGGDSVSTAVLRDLIAWTKANGLREYWGRGESGSFGPYLPDAGRKYVCGYLYTDGLFVIAFRFIKDTPGFTGEEKRAELSRRFNRIPEARLAEDHTAGYASFHSRLLTGAARQLFFDTLAWYFAEVRAAIASASTEPTP